MQRSKVLRYSITSSASRKRNPGPWGQAPVRQSYWRPFKLGWRLHW